MRARLLAGSHLGIAYTNPFRDALPGVAYPSNLTPDPRTGLGNWSDAQIAAAIRSGELASDPGHLMVMPWPLYQRMSEEDVKAIVAYLRSIPAIQHPVPKRVAPGTSATTPYVYFGVFRSGPALGSLKTARVSVAHRIRSGVRRLVYQVVRVSCIFGRSFQGLRMTTRIVENAILGIIGPRSHG